MQVRPQTRFEYLQEQYTARRRENVLARIDPETYTPLITWMEKATDKLQELSDLVGQKTGSDINQEYFQDHPGPAVNWKFYFEYLEKLVSAHEQGEALRLSEKELDREDELIDLYEDSEPHRQKMAYDLYVITGGQR